MERTNGRKADEKRSVKITRHFTKYAEGSVLIEDGETQVLCTASVITGVPSWLKGRGGRLGDCGIRTAASRDRYTDGP